jgi:hypothetical protein
MEEIEEEELWKTEIDAVMWLLDNQLIVEKPKKEGNMVTLVFLTCRLLTYAPELSTDSSDNRDDVFILFYVTLRSECM